MSWTGTLTDHLGTENLDRTISTFTSAGGGIGYTVGADGALSTAFLTARGAISASGRYAMLAASTSAGGDLGLRFFVR